MQAPFAGSNRFSPAPSGAGITDRRVDVSAGMSADDRDHLLHRGVGITSLVARATARADELEDDELVAGVDRLAATVASSAPALVAILGVTAHRTAFEHPRAVLGLQELQLSGRPVWVVPNPSGRNAHAPLPTLVAPYREAARRLVADGHDVWIGARRAASSSTSPAAWARTS